MTTTASRGGSDVEPAVCTARHAGAHETASAIASTTSDAAVQRSARRIVSRAITRSGSTSGRRPRRRARAARRAARARRLEPLGRGDDDVVELAVLLLGSRASCGCSAAGAAARAARPRRRGRGERRRTGRRGPGRSATRPDRSPRRAPAISATAARRRAETRSRVSARQRWRSPRATCEACPAGSCRCLLTRDRLPPAARERFPDEERRGTGQHEPPQTLPGLALARHCRRPAALGLTRSSRRRSPPASAAARRPRADRR